MEQTFYQELGLVGNVLRWMDKHPMLSNVIIATELTALFFVALFYNFTTNI